MAAKVLFLNIFLILMILDGNFAAKRVVKFQSETVDPQTPGITYKIVATSSYFGLFGQNSRSQCSQVCMNEDSCQGFYMDGGSCVFAVTDDVSNEIGRAPTVTPDSAQRLQAKSKNFMSFS